MASQGNFIYIQDNVIQLIRDRQGAGSVWHVPFWGVERTIKLLLLRGNYFSAKAEYGVENVLVGKGSCEGALLVNKDSKEAVFAPSMGHFESYHSHPERVWDRDGSVIALILKCRWKELIELNWPGWRIKVANMDDFAVHECIEVDFDKIPELRQPTLSELIDFPLSKHDSYIYIARRVWFGQYFDLLFEVSGTPETRVVRYSTSKYH